MLVLRIVLPIFAALCIRLVDHLVRLDLNKDLIGVSLLIDFEEDKESTSGLEALRLTTS